MVKARCLRYERTPFGKMVRKQYEAHEKYFRRNEMRELQIREDGLSNTLTSVLKDNLILVAYETAGVVVKEKDALDKTSNERRSNLVRYRGGG